MKKPLVMLIEIILLYTNIIYILIDIVFIQNNFILTFCMKTTLFERRDARAIVTKKPLVMMIKIILLLYLVFIQNNIYFNFIQQNPHMTGPATNPGSYLHHNPVLNN